MKISYGILTHNEGECVDTLISFLVKNKNPDDEIVVVDDYSTERTQAILEEHLVDDNILLFKRALDKDFAAQKNYLNSKCDGDYIFQIDADELPSEYMIANLHNVLEQNPTVNMFIVPRINIVTGITAEHIEKWGWTINEEGYINFPDWQTRIYKNTDSIVWKGKVHERIVGTDTYTYLPAEEHWCLYHRKDITKQELQNDLYNTI